MPAARSAASLGELAQRAGLIDAAQLERLVAELRDRVRAGRPTSLARLLIERGLEGGRVRAAAASGTGLAGVRCDACNTVHESTAVFTGREFACSRCGAFVVGLGETSVERVPAVPVPTDPGGGETTLGFAAILPIPGGGVPRTPAAPAPAEGGRTMAFAAVLPLPPGAAPSPIPVAPAFPPVPVTPPNFVDSNAETKSDPDRKDFEAAFEAAGIGVPPTHDAPAPSAPAPSPLRKPIAKRRSYSSTAAASAPPRRRTAVIAVAVVVAGWFVTLGVLYITGVIGGPGEPARSDPPRTESSPAPK